MKIAIYGQYYQSNTNEIVTQVVNFFKRHNVEIFIEKKFSENVLDLLPDGYKTFSSHEELEETTDFLISIGGDGTILRAVTYIRDKNIPIVGINAGRLGFLATVQMNEIQLFLERLIQGKYTI